MVFNSSVFSQSRWLVECIALLFFTLIFLSPDSNAQTSNQKSGEYATDAESVRKGQRLFEDNCSACHNFSQKSIGPSLGQAVNESSKDWLRRFIKNAPEMIASKDVRAASLFKEYKQVMPPFTHLEGDELEAILAFIYKNQQQSVENPNVNLSAILDPVPAKIPLTGGSLYLEYQSTAPATGSVAPLARLNKMQTLPGKPQRQFIVDLQGILYEIKDNKEWKQALNIRELRPHFVSKPGLGTGFGSFAFHPDFRKSNLLYTTHAEKVDGVRGDIGFSDTIKVGLQWVLMEWTIKDPLKTPFEVEAREVMRIDMPTTSHGVQEITFNPQAKKGDGDYGLLYICIGDGGSAEKKGFYPLCASNKVAGGSILRIDPLGNNSANGRYGIPASNPYVQEKDPAVLKEIFCRGLRNPNRITWTPDRKMLICDIGQSNIEEINLGVAGADYGWPEREGTFLVNPRADINKVFPVPDDEPAKKYTYPILQYDHDEGKAVSGGFVYTGKSIRSLKGKYVFADITNGRFFITEGRLLPSALLSVIRELKIYVNNKPTTFQEINGMAKPDTRIGIGPGGEIYVFTKADGKLYKVVGYKPAS